MSSTAPLDVSVSKEDQQAAYSRLLSSEGFTPGCIGKTNPYTGEGIRNEQDYDLYLRERAFHVACEAKYSVAANEAIISASRQFSADSALSVETKVKAERIRLDELDRQRRRSFEQEYRLRCQKTFAILAALLIIVSGVFSFSRYRSGFTAAKEKYIDSAAAEYQRGYDLGYSDGNSERSSGSSSKRADAAVDSPIIGNKNTKKFHSSDCSYLPNKSNQKAFDSYEDAIDAGYDPCGHCGGR